MRNGMAILVMASIASLALGGLSASAAFAESNPPSANGIEATTFGPYNIMTNDNPSVGITYPGAGDQATITNNPGNSYLESDGSFGGNAVYVIHNSNGNCLRMRDASNAHAVMEESGCNLSDNNERFAYIPASDGTVAFLDVSTGQYLGESCPAKDGNKIWGVSGNTGTCFRWQLH